MAKKHIRVDVKRMRAFIDEMKRQYPDGPAPPVRPRKTLFYLGDGRAYTYDQVTVAMLRDAADWACNKWHAARMDALLDDVIKTAGRDGMPRDEIDLMTLWEYHLRKERHDELDRRQAEKLAPNAGVRRTQRCAKAKPAQAPFKRWLDEHYPDGVSDRPEKTASVLKWEAGKDGVEADISAIRRVLQKKP